MKGYTITFENIKWNDENYQNDWFQSSTDYERLPDIDVIESLIEEEEEFCNEEEGRDDLKITHYQFKIELDEVIERTSESENQITLDFTQLNKLDQFEQADVLWAIIERMGFENASMKPAEGGYDIYLECKDEE